MSWNRIFVGVSLALLLGASPEVRGGSLTLLDAIRLNESDRVQRLLAAGADPNSQDANHASALMYAALYAGAPVLDMLLRAGADPKYRDQNGLTALTWAAHNYQSAKVLLDAGADVNTKSNLGAIPLATAAAYPGNAALLELMLEKGADVNVTVFGSTALTMAALTGDIANVALLLKHGANPNAPGPKGLSALHLAVLRGDREMAQVLLDAGADVKLRTARGEDVLERYGFWNDPELVRMLLERGVDPAKKDSIGNNSLLFAASSDTVTPEVFGMLLKDNKPTDAKNAYGDGVLQAALRRGDAPIVKLLGGALPPTASPRVREVAPTPLAIQGSVTRSLDLLAKTGPSVAKMGCVSCHHQSLPSLAGWYARRAGIDSGQIADTNRKLVYPILQSSNQFMQHGAAPAGEAATVSWELIGLSSDGQPADFFTDVAVNYIASTQMADGSWPERWGRPPLEYSVISATAVAIRALHLYGFPSRRQEFNDRSSRGAAWLAKARPTGLEESAMRLLGLVWGGASQDVIDRAAHELASAQHSDGGWAQLPMLPPDAYATGKALVALRESGSFGSRSRVFDRGARFLLGTQELDGSWHVRGRSLPVLPLFESGFPHGRDQFISAAGTSWAAMALSLAMPPVPAIQPATRPTVPAVLVSSRRTMATAMHGPADQHSFRHHGKA